MLKMDLAWGRVSFSRCRFGNFARAVKFSTIGISIISTRFGLSTRIPSHAPKNERSIRVQIFQRTDWLRANQAHQSWSGPSYSNRIEGRISRQNAG